MKELDGELLHPWLTLNWRTVTGKCPSRLLQVSEARHLPASAVGASLSTQPLVHPLTVFSGGPGLMH